MRRAIVLLGLLTFLAPAAAEDGLSGADFVDPRVLELDRLDPVLPHPARIVLSGRMIGTYGRPRVFVIRPNGKALQIDPSEVDWEEPRFSAELALGHGRGVYRVEISASNDKGLTNSGTRMRLFSGVPADTPDDPAPPDEPAPNAPAGPLMERRFFDLVNEHRAGARLDPLEWLEPLALAARDHAAACAKAGRLEHRVDRSGNLAHRLASRLEWPRCRYSTPPGRPDPGPDAPDYVAAALDARFSLDLVLYRWKRFAAFAVPMTGETYTHAACGIATTPAGHLYVVFAYAQLNSETVRDDLEERYRRLLRDFAAADGGQRRADQLREIAGWRRREASSRVRRHLSDKDEAVRAAAIDGQLLLDETKGREEVESLWDEVDKAILEGRRTADALAILDALERVLYLPGVSKQAGARRATLVAQADDLLAEAEALREAGDEAGARKLLRRVRSDYPGTEAADRSRRLLSGD